MSEKLIRVNEVVNYIVDLANECDFHIKKLKIAKAIIFWEWLLLYI